MFLVTMCKMNQKLTREQRVFLIEKCWYHHKKSELVFNDLEQFLGVPRSRCETFYHLCNQFHPIGSVNDLPRNGRPQISWTVENVDLVAPECCCESTRVNTEISSLRSNILHNAFFFKFFGLSNFFGTHSIIHPSIF